MEIMHSWSVLDEVIELVCVVIITYLEVDNPYQITPRNPQLTLTAIPWLVRNKIMNTCPASHTQYISIDVKHVKVEAVRSDKI